MAIEFVSHVGNYAGNTREGSKYIPNTGSLLLMNCAMSRSVTGRGGTSANKSSLLTALLNPNRRVGEGVLR